MLLIRGGRVFDGDDFLAADVLVRNGMVEKIAPGISGEGCRVVDATGMTVLPGLTDVHLHIKGVSAPAWSVDAAEGTASFGVTAAADASASRGDEAFLDALPVDAGVFVIVGTKEPLSFEKTRKRLEQYGQRVAGIKVIYDQKANPALSDETVLKRICDFAHERKLPVLVHTANSPVSMQRLLAVLAPGDIATHVFHGGSNNAGEDGFACLRTAKARGVFLDSCICAGEHVDFEIFRQAVAAGIYPDLVGTDLADEIAPRSGGYGLPVCMTVARVLGMPEKEILRAVTGTAGKALGRPWGRLREGGPADLALLQWTAGPVNLLDRYGNRVESDRGYRCRMTVRKGNVVFEDSLSL